MRFSAISALVSIFLVAGCANTIGSRVMVSGVGPDDLLKLRAGPGLEHRVILGLPDGTVLDRRNCIDTVNRAWCRVSLAVAPGVTGYVSSSYLVPR